MNIVEHFDIGVAVALLRTRQVRAAASTARAEAVAEGAVQTKLIFTEFRHFRVASEGILFLGLEGSCGYEQKNQAGAEEDYYSVLSEGSSESF
jgi:hypothetical protein